ncbi:glycoside hydrolase family 26 protein [Paenibacillus sp. YIM B09110]|uniref:glycoside hydrolase family 26 protein n=1 Tax=Paenibacillus sp. YIM B09110 TaxID=3126102 RepID=UPI00301C36FF
MGAGNVPIVEKQDWTIHVNWAEAWYKLAKAEPETGAYLGAYVLQDEAIASSMNSFNKLTGRTHASFFKYVGYGQPFPKEWVEQVKSVGAFPHIAWEPNKGLAQVQDDAYLRQFAQEASEARVPMFLRFASEMNGTWTAYGGDPAMYKQKWRLVHDRFAELASNVAMVWTVLTVPEKPIERFYPGDAYVDWVGVNVYNVKYHNGNEDEPAAFEDPLDLLDTVYNRFSARKPIQLSEFGVTHYNTTDHAYDIGFAAAKIKRLYGSLEHKYPRVKAVFYFDVNNVTAYNKSRRVNDYSIATEPALREAYRVTTSMGKEAAGVSEIKHFISAASDPSLEGKPVHQRFTYRGALFAERGRLYADEQFYRELLHLNVRIQQSGKGNLVAVMERSAAEAGKAVRLPVLQRKVWSGMEAKGRQRVYRFMKAIPLRDAAAVFGLKLRIEGTDIYIEA